MRSGKIHQEQFQDEEEIGKYPCLSVGIGGKKQTKTD